MKIFVPEFIIEIARNWNPIDQGRVGGVFALLEDDGWRHENRVDWMFSPTQKEELGLTENDTVWAVAHSRVTVAFFETTDSVSVVYINRRSAMNPGWT
ncbi:MAG: hypothetical protein BZY87_02845 [SAR202 cluster bacterium Io17-Chloro-G6]|nr:MAG: hypothetical protein BZY87_02845 [SAR202 cluster bacterium Io17-Chloro-G6]